MYSQGSFWWLSRSDAHPSLSMAMRFPRETLLAARTGYLGASGGGKISSFEVTRV